MFAFIQEPVYVRAPVNVTFYVQVGQESYKTFSYPAKCFIGPRKSESVKVGMALTPACIAYVPAIIFCV